MEYWTFEKIVYTFEITISHTTKKILKHAQPTPWAMYAYFTVISMINIVVQTKCHFPQKNEYYNEMAT